MSKDKKRIWNSKKNLNNFIKIKNFINLPNQNINNSANENIEQKIFDIEKIISFKNERIKINKKQWKISKLKEYSIMMEKKSKKYQKMKESKNQKIF